MLGKYQDRSCLCNFDARGVPYVERMNDLRVFDLESRMYLMLLVLADERKYSPTKNVEERLKE